MSSPETPHNKALQLTTNPLRGLSAAELGRYAALIACGVWFQAWYGKVGFQSLGSFHKSAVR